MRLLAFTSVVFLSFILGGCGDKFEGDVWPMVENCDLHQQTCHAQYANASASLTLNPQPIPIAKPLQVEVTLQNITTDKLKLDISGINMYMGYNRVVLQADANNPNQFKGQTMLAFCTNEVMYWQLTLLAYQADGQVTQIPFKLETRNR